MPIFGYTCEKCDHKFERIVSFSEREEPQACNKCESTATTRELFPAKAASPLIKGDSARNHYGLPSGRGKPRH